MALTREQVEKYLKGQGHPHPDADGTFDEFMYGGERRAMYDEAVLNNYALPDVDRWFHLVKVMGIDLPFDTAMKIDGALHEADLETMELNLPEERFGLDPYGRGVFKGPFEDVKEQIRKQVIQKDDFSVGQLADLQVPGLKLADSFQLYAQLRGEADGSKTLVFMNPDRYSHLGHGLIYDLSLSKDMVLTPHEFKEIVDQHLPAEDPLHAFIEQEVPFRMRQLNDIDISDKQCTELIDALKENVDVIFDYDRLDSFLMSKYEELAGLDSERIKSLRGEISNLRHELEGAIEFGPADLVPVIDKRLCTLQAELDAALGIKPRMFIFDDELCLNDDNVTLNGYLWAVDGLVDRLSFSEDMENINFYANYNLATGKMELLSTYDTPTADGELNKMMAVELTAEEQEALVGAMEEYCHNTYGVSCLEFANELRADLGLALLQDRSSVPSTLEAQIQVAQALVDGSSGAEKPRSRASAWREC